MTKEGDLLFDCYPREGIYSVFIVKERVRDVDYVAWRCDLMQLHLDKDFVTARSDLIFTERYLNTLSPEPY